jgi:N-hydroxyarylamine O-acetyltransferase
MSAPPAVSGPPGATCCRHDETGSAVVGTRRQRDSIDQRPGQRRYTVICPSCEANSMNLERYFRRIGYVGESRPTLPVLEALLSAHVCSIPFENLDVQLGCPLTTDIDAAYDKIVLNDRGGWCYEQNGLFGWALAQVGFDVTRLSASVMRQERGASSAASHLSLQVCIPGIPDRAYLVDVGFGGSMVKPIEFKESEVSQPPFRLGLRRIDGTYWRFWEDIGSGEFSYDFRTEPADESALSAKCRVLQSDPSSNFVLNLVVQLRSPRQHKALRGRVLKVADPGGTRTETLPSAEALVDTLRGEFRLEVPGIVGLWPRVVARHEAFLAEQSEHRQPLGESNSQT